MVTNDRNRNFIANFDATALGAISAVGIIEGYALPWVSALAAASMLLFTFRMRSIGMSREVIWHAAGLIGLVACCLLSATWAIVPKTALVHSAILGAIAVAAIGLHCTIYAASDVELAVPCRGAVIGVGIGLAYLLFEVLTGLSIRRAIDEYVNRRETYYHVFPMAEAWRLNRGIATLAMLFWPALLIITKLFGRHVINLLFFAIVAFCIFMLNHKTSMLALAISSCVWLWSRMHFASALTVVRAAWVIACVLIMPIVILLSHTNYREKEWLTPTVQARIAVWTTLRREMRQPLLGIGAGNHKHLKELVPDREASKSGEPDPIHERVDHHPHNAYLQVWNELGVIGSAMLMLLGLSLLRAIDHARVEARPYLLSTFVVTATLMAATFGLWQTWYLMLFLVTSVLAVLAARADARNLSWPLLWRPEDERASSV